MKCMCLTESIKNMEESGFENIEPPLELLSGRLYLSFKGKKKGMKKEREIPVLLSKCPFCGKPYESEEQNDNP